MRTCVVYVGFLGEEESAYFTVFNDYQGSLSPMRAIHSENVRLSLKRTRNHSSSRLVVAELDD
mgnify:CR=1 FL=1|jgi:hypothetical protein